MGAAVNVGKSLRVKTRGEVAKTLGLPCGHYPWCSGDKSPQDKMWCTKAQELGYDSIQIQNSGHAQSELLVCKGCGEAALNGACPPLELRRGSWDTTKSPCECSDAGDNLNCGEDADWAKPFPKDWLLHTCHDGNKTHDEGMRRHDGEGDEDGAEGQEDGSDVD